MSPPTISTWKGSCGSKGCSHHFPLAVFWLAMTGTSSNELSIGSLSWDANIQRAIWSFGGAYTDFLSKREDYLATQARREDVLAGQVRKEIEWLRRGPPARTTKAKYRIDEAGKMIEDLADLRDRNTKSTVAPLDFSASGRKTRDLIVAKGLTSEAAIGFSWKDSI